MGFNNVIRMRLKIQKQIISNNNNSLGNKDNNNNSNCSHGRSNCNSRINHNNNCSLVTLVHNNQMTVHQLFEVKHSFKIIIAITVPKHQVFSRILSFILIWLKLTLNLIWFEKYFLIEFFVINSDTIKRWLIKFDIFVLIKRHAR